MGFLSRSQLQICWYRPIVTVTTTSTSKSSTADASREISPKFSSIELTSNNDTRITTSTSGRTQRIKVAGQYWSFKFQSIAMEIDDFNSLFSFLVQQDGQVKPFVVIPPIVNQSTATGSITVSDDYAAGVITCRSTGGSGLLKKGDMFKFSNHDKVYMLTSDVNLDQLDSSEDVINFYPNLVTPITNTTTIVHKDVPFVVYLDGEKLMYSTNIDGTYKMQFGCNEEI